MDVTNVRRNSTPKMRAAFWSELTENPLIVGTGDRVILRGIDRRCKRERRAAARGNAHQESKLSVS
jgi:hypothetical protein